MKRTLISLGILLVAGSLAAATDTPATPRTTTAVPDSPLVAAAKKSNRKGKKRIVITDATLKNSTGHISTATKQNEIVSRSEKPSEQVLAESKEKDAAADREKAAKAAAEAKQKETLRRSASAEENQLYNNEDPSSPPPTSTSSQPQPSKPHDSQRP